jgi:hypothetical protein
VAASSRTVAACSSGTGQYPHSISATVAAARTRAPTELAALDRTGGGNQKAGDPVDSWINPTSVVGGLLAVATAAYLSAVYLV